MGRELWRMLGLERHNGRGERYGAGVGEDG